MNSEIVVDDLRLEVRRSARRRTMQITVDRGGELRVYAPAECPTSRLERLVREKRFWIYTKLAAKELLRGAAAPAKEFVTGEGFAYLGRTYRLRLVAAQECPLKLVNGRLQLVRSESERGREHLVRWYVEHAQAWLLSRARSYAPRLSTTVDRVQVRDLGNRWGSCGVGGMLNFHWATIMLPPWVVDYVIVHELAHRHHANHGPEFWQRVERAMPDSMERRRWLAANGARCSAI